MVEHHRFPLQFTRQAHEGEILVVGLGRFGSAVAESLVAMDFDVLAVDFDMARVQQYSGVLPHVVQCDTTDPRALQQIGAAEVTTAVVCIGSDVESSVLTTSCLVDLGIDNIWAKAITAPHGRILERVGAHHVVFPEAAMGERVAHLLSGRMLEYVQIDDDFVIVETGVPAAAVGKSLGEAQLRATYGVTVVAIKHAGAAFTYATAESKLGATDLIVVAGHRPDVERFAGSV